MSAALKIYCTINFSVRPSNRPSSTPKVYRWSLAVGVAAYGKAMARCWSSFFRRNVAFASLFREEELLNGILILLLWDYHSKENCADTESLSCGLLRRVPFSDVHEFDIPRETPDIVVVIAWFRSWRKLYARGICRIILFSCRMWFLSLFQIQSQPWAIAFEWEEKQCHSSSATVAVSSTYFLFNVLSCKRGTDRENLNLLKWMCQWPAFVYSLVCRRQRMQRRVVCKSFLVMSARLLKLELSKTY